MKSIAERERQGKRRNHRVDFYEVKTNGNFITKGKISHNRNLQSFHGNRINFFVFHRKKLLQPVTNVSGYF